MVLFQKAKFLDHVTRWPLDYLKAYRYTYDVPFITIGINMLFVEHQRHNERVEALVITSLKCVQSRLDFWLQRAPS